jgi:DNA-binding MarR family transcriptional regulator
LIDRARDPADERQVRVRLAPAGRRLLDRIETEVGPQLIGSTGLGKDFHAVRKAVAGLRDNLLRSLKGEA